MVWLVPITLFWTLTALYVGGMVEATGGGPVRQILALLVSFVLFLVAWGVLRIPFGSMHPILHLAIPSVLSVIALPLVVRLGHMGLGIRLRADSLVH